MEMLLQPNTWTCLPTAFAMATESSIQDVFDYCGHDGSQIIWPDLDDPYKRRAFHLQEMYDFCIQQLVYPVEIEANPIIGAPLKFNPQTQEAEPMTEGLHIVRFRDDHRVWNYMQLRSGVLLGYDDRQCRHAVAWNHKEQRIYDPVGFKYTLDKFEVESFIMLV